MTDDYDDESQRLALDCDHSASETPSVDQPGLVTGRISSISEGLSRQRERGHAESYIHAYILASGETQYNAVASQPIKTQTYTQCIWLCRLN